MLVATDGRKVEDIPLRSMAHATRTPEIGKTYIHRGRRAMRVLQKLDGGVLVRPDIGIVEAEFRGVNAFREKMTIYVETTQDYVDDEYLHKGLFEYVGKYNYVTTVGAPMTVRKFREVPHLTD